MSGLPSQPRLPRTRLAVTLAAALLAGNASVARGQGAWYEGFEGPQVSWREFGGNARYEIVLHQRVQGEAHTGNGCERLKIAGTGGTHVYLAHEIGRPRVIQELAPSVQVRSDRAGLQMLAEVVLPRTRNPQTGQPLTTLLRGTSYSKVGQWQQLRIDDLPHLLAQQTRILRSQYGPEVDPREAYLQQILLNVYGGPGVTNVWIDDLDVAGYVETAGPAPPKPAATERPESPLAATPSPPYGGWSSRPEPARDPGRRRIRMDQSVLLVDERPTFVRAIRDRGEPLALFKRLGFNAVWFAAIPDSRRLREAAELGLWAICPAPPPSQATGPDGSIVPMPAIGREYDGVLAWDLGSRLDARQLDSVKRWAEQIRTADRHNRRPLLAYPQNRLRSYSRVVDVLLLGRSPLLGSLNLGDYATWLRQRPQLARPGTPVWTVVTTQPPESLQAQWSLLSPRSALAGFGPEQLRLMVYLSLLSGGRGLLFESFSPLDAGDPATRMRARSLELLNLELDVIEPWLAAGTLDAWVAGSRESAMAAVFRRDRADLLLPMWLPAGAQQVPGPPPDEPVSFVVPGVSQSKSVYVSQMVPGRLRPVRHKRATGGTRITLENLDLTTQVLFTQDALFRNSRGQKVRRIGHRAAQLRRQLAELERQAVEATVQRLRRSGGEVFPFQPGGLPPEFFLAAARQSLQTCDGHLASGDDSSAYLAAGASMRALQQLERTQWAPAAGSLASPVASPLAVHFPTLPDHWRLLRRVTQSPPGANRLAGGDFEDLSTWLHSGWDHFQHPIEGIYTEAVLAPEAARGGKLGLRLTASPIEPGQSPAQVETPPVWITSAPVQVEAGQWIAIGGWVRVEPPIRGSVDGLMIIDSLAGQPLAARYPRTDGWQQFVLYRVAPRSGPVTVTFALAGLGSAWIDDVTIRPLGPDVQGEGDGVDRK